MYWGFKFKHQKCRETIEVWAHSTPEVERSLGARFFSIRVEYAKKTISQLHSTGLWTTKAHPSDWFRERILKCWVDFIRISWISFVRTSPAHGADSTLSYHKGQLLFRNNFKITLADCCCYCSEMKSMDWSGNLKSQSHCHARENTAFKGMAGAIESTMDWCKWNCGCPISGCPAWPCQGNLPMDASVQNRLAAKSWQRLTIDMRWPWPWLILTIWRINI